MRLFRGNAKNTAQLGNGEEFVYPGGHVLLDPASRQLLSDVLPP
jgi:hypothetical protein